MTDLFKFRCEICGGHYLIGRLCRKCWKDISILDMAVGEIGWSHEWLLSDMRRNPRGGADTVLVSIDNKMNGPFGSREVKITRIDDETFNIEYQWKVKRTCTEILG